MQWESKTKGFMNYAGGRCSECSKAYVKRSFDEIELTWEHCAYCDEGGVPYIKLYFEEYERLMDEGAVLVRQI